MRVPRVANTAFVEEDGIRASITVHAVITLFVLFLGPDVELGDKKHIELSRQMIGPDQMT